MNDTAHQTPRSKNSKVSRRTLLRYSALMSALAVTSHTAPALARRLILTPAQGRGPFYPLSKPLDHDNNLTVIKDKPGRAQGELLHVMGQVTDQYGRAVSGARVEIWQTNAFGRYHHHYDRRDLPLDPNFQGYGQNQTDTEGAYRFLTVHPVAYPASGTWTRPPHIHFAVSGLGVEPLVTQMYFAGNPLNAQDHLLHSIEEPAERQQLLVSLQPPPPSLDSGAKVAIFNLVLHRKG